MEKALLVILYLIVIVVIILGVLGFINLRVHINNNKQTGEGLSDNYFCLLKNIREITNAYNSKQETITLPCTK